MKHLWLVLLAQLVCAASVYGWDLGTAGDLVKNLPSGVVEVQKTAKGDINFQIHTIGQDVNLLSGAAMQGGRMVTNTILPVFKPPVISSEKLGAVTLHFYTLRDAVQAAGNMYQQAVGAYDTYFKNTVQSVAGEAYRQAAGAYDSYVKNLPAPNPLMPLLPLVKPPLVSSDKPGAFTFHFYTVGEVADALGKKLQK